MSEPLVVPGEPVPKGRPRFSRNGRTYTPKATLDAERALGWELAAHFGNEPCRGPVRVVMRFYCGDHRRRDLDNLLKLALDAANGVVWEDDSQVEHLEAQVYRGEDRPRTEIEIERRP